MDAELFLQLLDRLRGMLLQGRKCALSGHECGWRQSIALRRETQTLAVGGVMTQEWLYKESGKEEEVVG